MQAQLIPLEKITESPTNPRRRAAPEEDAQLLESVRAQGVLQPVLVRPRDDGGVELVFGHRRLRAAREAGLAELPAVLRAMSDDEATEAAVAENASRHDLHPLDEAEAFGRLRGLGRTVEEIAAKVGKSGIYIARRLRLLELAEPVRKLLEEGKLDVPRALLAGQIADPALQVEAAEFMVAPDWRGDPPTLSECREIAQERMRSLAKVPWALDDAELLPAAGACIVCPKRTGAQGGLFDVGADEEDFCTDGRCFAAKKQAHGDRVLAEAHAQGRRTLTAGALKDLPRTYDGTPEGYRRLDAVSTEDPKRRTYRQLLKKAPEAVVVAKSKDGEVLELVATKGLAGVLRKAGHDFKAAKASGVSAGGGTARKPGEKRERGSQAVRDEQLRRELDAVWEGARGHGDSAELLRLVVLEAWTTWDGTNEILARLGIPKLEGKDAYKKERQAFESWVARASASDLLAALVLGDVVRESWRGIPDTVAKLLSIDRKKIAAGLKADLAKLAAAEKKAAPVAGKKAPAKKARETKPAKKRAAKGAK